MNSKKRLNRREKELLGSFERGEWTSSVKSNADLKILKNVAKASQTKDKRINIRIPSRVLEEIQLIALEEGIPYQTLISSVLHKFATRRLIDSRASITKKKIVGSRAA